VKLARQLAEKTLDEDPQLASPRFNTIRESVFREEGAQAMLQ
jgi:hypothetical protein